MKRVEIRKVGAKSVFKVSVYLMSVPTAILLTVGLVMLLFGSTSGNEEMIIMGIILSVVYPIFFMVVYGLIGMLAAVIYNKLAGKFGGLEVGIEDIDTE